MSYVNVMSASWPSTPPPPIIVFSNSRQQQLRQRWVASASSSSAYQNQYHLSAAALKSSSNYKLPTDGQKDEGELSSTDVLWALQRASADKTKNNKAKKTKKKKMMVKDNGEAEEEDYVTQARPICIKSNWKARIDGLAKRLEGLSDIN